MQTNKQQSLTENGTAGAESEAAPFHVETHFSWLRTRMSTERTLMSWNRTSLSLISFGFTIYQFFKQFQQATAGPAALLPEAPRNLGLALMGVGTLGTLVALWQYYRFVTYLNGDEFKAIARGTGLPHWSLTFLISLFLALIGIVATGWVLLRG